MVIVGESIVGAAVIYGRCLRLAFSLPYIVHTNTKAVLAVSLLVIPIIPFYSCLSAIYMSLVSICL